MNSRTYVRGVLTVLFVFLLLPSGVAAQEQLSGDLEESITELAEDNARLYTHPITSGFGAGLNSGWFHTAGVESLLGVNFGVRAMGAFAPEADERFTPVLPDEVTVDGTNRTYEEPYGAAGTTPTAVGEGTGIVLEPQGQFEKDLIAAGEDPDDYVLRFPDGFDIPAVPMVSAQATVGVGFATEITLRAVPEMELHPDVGSVRSFGIGGKHSVTGWFPGAVPVDLAVAAGFQSLEIGDFFSADSRHISLIGSKDLAVLTIYGAAGLESSESEVVYEVVNPNLPEGGTDVSFTDEADNRSRFTLGFNLDLLFLHLNAGYAFAEYSVANASVGLTF